MAALRTVAFVLLLGVSLPAEDVLVAHPGVPLEALDAAAMADLFLGRRTTWPNGQRVVVVLLRRGPAHDRLAGELGKTPRQLTNWWKRLVFTGEGTMPEQVEDETSLLARIAATPRAVGWIERGDRDLAQVKQLRRN